MVDVATKTSEFHGIELEDNEKNEVLSFILDLDENGTSNFYKTSLTWILRLTYKGECRYELKNS